MAGAVLAVAEAGAIGAGGISPADLAELMSAFNEVTARLARTHESLRAEVARLNSELRSANEQLQRSHRLAGLGQMAAGIAHEVRNPLGSIGLYARMLIEDLADRPAERCVAGKIADAVRGLDGVVGDVLNFARELRVRPEPERATELLERALEACCPERSPERAGLAIRREWGGNQELVVECDGGLIHQALVNVIRNGLEASTGPGRVLTLGVAERRLADGRRAVGLRIGDSGAGVTAGVVERMFNPFFTTRATGTGLGLPIVHRIVDAHGGRVDVSNNAERDPGAAGATVELVLPESQEVAAETVAVQESRA